MKTVVALAAGVALAMPAIRPAAAHVTLEQPQAVAGSTYKAVFRVPHGCAGQPTVRLRVQIPPGIAEAKPMPKPGWQLTLTKGPLEHPITAEGRTIADGVKEVAWSGGSLPDDQYDEFVIRVRLPDTPGGTVWFPTVQDCAPGVVRWIEIPAAGKLPDDYKAPAPGVRLLPRP